MERRALGSDEFGRYVYTVEPSGKVAFFNRGSGARELEVSPPSLAGATVVASSRSLLGDFVAAAPPTAAWRSCRCASCRCIRTAPSLSVKVDVRERGMVSLDPQARAAQRVSYLEEGERKFVAGQVSDNEVALWWTDDGGEERRALVRAGDGHKVTAVRVGRTGTAIAGTDRGEVYHWLLGETATLTDVSPVGASPITALEYIIGNNTFIAGTGDGQVSAWFRAPVTEETQAMVRARAVRAAGRGRDGHRGVDEGSHVCDGRSGRPCAPPPSDVGPHARDARGRNRRCRVW